jgi:hypothetical protein
MNKSRGLAAGAVVLTGITGFLLRPLATPDGASGAAARSLVGTKSQARLGPEEGPWIASCNYWAAVRPSAGDPQPRTDVSIRVFADGSYFNSKATAAEAGGEACSDSADPWGIPGTQATRKGAKNLPQATSATVQDRKPQITAIIATVPEPTREHLALDFDHTIDGLLQAANDNGYLESYTWLPWKSPDEESVELAATAQDQLEEQERERNRLREPGLIVMKYFDQQDRDPAKRHEQYYKVLYLFLVGNTPLEGVQGDQLANALKYEAVLQANRSICFRSSVVESDAKGDELCNTAMLGRQNLTNSAGVSPPKPKSDQATGKATPSTKPGQPKPASGTQQSSPVLQNQFEPSPYALTIIGPDYSGAAASLRAQLLARKAMVPQKDFPPPFPAGIQSINVYGEVGTDAAQHALTEGTDGALNTPTNGKDLIHFVSFANNARFERDKLKELTCNDKVRTTLLVEDNTAYGAVEAPPPEDASVLQASEASPREQCLPWQTIKFPRGISLLRNAHEEEPGHFGEDNGVTPSPYLHLSLEDKSDKGTIAQFSTQTASSQEAQLVEITEQLQKADTQLIVLFSSNALDTIFLARFLHRTFPDARLLEFGADLLVSRDTDNQPLVGAVSIDAYPLLGPMPSDLNPESPRRPFASTITESIYNTASFALWDKSTQEPYLANYRDVFAAKVGQPLDSLYPSLWAMAIGRDAFYPIGVLDRCGSLSAPKDESPILPLLSHNSKGIGSCVDAELPKPNNGFTARSLEMEQILQGKAADRGDPVHFPFSPSLWWYYLCGAVFVACIAHAMCMLFASFSSLAIRDLAIDEMNNPCRRAVFIHIGTVMLFGMAVVVSYPVFPLLQITILSRAAVLLALGTILAGMAALIVSFRKAFPHVLRLDIPSSGEFPYRRSYVYLVIHAIAFAAMIGIPLLWIKSCEVGEDHVGLFFSYRCLNPLSGVSPLLPILLLLLGWYLWSILQTRRLRFSEQTRPQIPGKVAQESLLFYVPDNELVNGPGGTDAHLYGSLTCLLITPNLLCWLSKGKLKTWVISTFLVIVYSGFLIICLAGLHPVGLERLLLNDKGGFPPSTTTYELLFEMLFFPLLLIALTGFLRMAVIWAALRRQLLRRLEFYPIRFAFGRMRTVGWFSMMRQSDLLERQRERARSLESMRQLAHNPEIQNMVSENQAKKLQSGYQRALNHVGRLTQIAPANHEKPMRAADADWNNAARMAFESWQDYPKDESEVKALFTYCLERDFSSFGELLLESVLIPYWSTQRVEMVESEEHETTHARRLVPGKTEGLEYVIHAGLIKEPPLPICLAEEFVVLRYVSLIRAVLVNIRHLLTFVSIAWVLSMIAWNSYPFRPREAMNMIFTALFVTLGVGATWVFSQMYRDVLLSRITRTEGNELGIEFYIRIAMFGAIPLMTWLAYQFPAFGAVVLKYLQPGIEAVK